MTTRSPFPILCPVFDTREMRFVRTRRRLAVAVFLVVAITAAAYAGAIKGGFVWDDRTLVLEDRQIHSVRNLPEIFLRDFFSTDPDVQRFGYYRPIVTASYLADLAISGERPAGFHLTNILLHAAASLLLLLLLREWFREDFVPTVAALLFAVHPIHTESVTWIAGRTDVICGLFIFAALLMWARYRRGVQQDRRAGRLLLCMLSSLVFLTLALMSKEMALVVPVLIVLADLVIFAEGDVRTAVRGGKEYLLLLLPLAFYGAIRLMAAPLSETAGRTFSLETTVFSFLATTWMYAGKLLFPIHLDAYIQNPPLTHPFHAVVAAGAAVVAFALVAVAMRRRFPAGAMAGGWFLLTLVPLSNVIRISAPGDMGFPAAERFLYVPSAAACLLVAAWIGRAGSWARSREGTGRTLAPVASSIVLVVIITAFALGVAGRNRVWHDEETFFRAALESSPNAALIHDALSGSLVRSGRLYEALPHARRAVELAPGEHSRRLYRNNLAGVYAGLGMIDRAEEVLVAAGGTRFARATMAYNAGELARATGNCREALDRYREALEIRSDHVGSLFRSAECLQALGRPSRALYLLREAAAADPENVEAANLLGVILQSLGRREHAVEAYRRAVALDPEHAVALSNLGVVLLEAAQWEEAEHYLRRALAAAPDLANTRIALSLVLLETGRLDDARIMVESVLVRDADNLKARLAFARVLLRLGNPARAGLELARVLELDPENPMARELQAAMTGLEQ